MGQVILRYDSPARARARFPTYIGRKKKCSQCRTRFKRGQHVQVSYRLIFCDHAGEWEERGDCEFTYHSLRGGERGGVTALYHGPRRTTRRARRK